jgi:hypothetical protein
MEKEIPVEHKYAVVYVGAPYGLDECGDLKYTCKTKAGARQWLRNRFGNSPMCLEMTVVELDGMGYWRYQPRTPREYFGVLSDRC